MEQKSNKQIVLDCYRKIIRDLDLSLVDMYIKENYIQHSPKVKDGRTGLLEMLAFLKTLPKPSEPGPSPIIRVIADGDLVAAHLDIKFMAQRVAVIDLFRLEGGMIAEHWDVGQALPADEDGEVTMTNGTSIIDEAADSVANKRLISRMFESRERAFQYFASNYLEHNASNKFSLTGIIKVHRIIGEGDFVVAHCESTVNIKVFSQFHIFRIGAGEIAEHWSAEQEVPDAMAHGNGMF
ncbi:nuclear transport factor 2 family protein [Mucilaginibacter sp. BJC16-A38]|uniref:nuclear transport factor 2 family protein n=1 Tax=Mucilaginibacter phenanthrenivorans TaxID=1234842 RepID=UPI00215703C2|nr:nuclear transport factor 2 family protein [Mucilaginibacter phenanthrenivorans]MCR8556044.1 nuclear transport factor 2 family protein [Mucilaginibacter phenanthrenivorans]